MYQIWICAVCGARRIYGNGVTEHYEAVIGCNGGCVKPTRHVYDRLTSFHAADMFGPRQMATCDGRN